MGQVDLKYDETDKLINDLYEWMAEMGADLKNDSCLRLIKSERVEEGRCVLATSDVEFNKELVQIPSKFILNFRFLLEDAELVKFIEWSNAKLTQGPEQNGYKIVRLDGIYLYLIIQRVDPKSRLIKFVDSMPKSYDTPEYFDAKLVQLLPDCLRPSAVKRIDRLNDKFKLFKGLLQEYVASHGVEIGSVSLLEKNFDFELFRWAFCAVNSRCFHIEEAEICSEEELSIGNRLFGELKLPETPVNSFRTIDEYKQQKEREDVVRNNLCCMIPYIDFLNHSFKSNACGYYDREKSAFVLRSIDMTESSDEAVMFASNADKLQHAIKTGQQVYITYGFHDNKTLLLEYGFIIDENSNDRIDFSPTELIGLLKNEEKEKFEAVLISENFVSDLSCNKFTGPSWYLLKVLNLICSLNDSVTNQPPESASLEDTNQRKKKKKKKIKAQNNEDIDTNNIPKIGQLFDQLLRKYHENLNLSLKNLNDASQIEHISPYHVEMSRKFCVGYLDIIGFNFNLVQNQDKWLELF